MNEKDSGRSFGELPTLGHGETRGAEPRSAAEGTSWTALGLSEAETLKPPAEGIRDDGRTDAARRWKPGDVILDRYVVEGELGQGGMGVVYGCLDKVGGVRVAVKGLPPELSHNSVEMEEVRENFQLVGDLRHPCIAGVRTLEKDGRGEFYLVMDLAEGESLRKWERDKWKAGGVPLPEAAAVLRQVASALDYAHGRKVVHRDVKPGNVMIDGKGDVKVLDFGLADQIRTSLSRASHAYRGTSGTGPYMAPEQWRGRPQDGKTDQYALGVMAYEMLAGRLPFENSEVSVLREVVLKEEPEGIPGVPEGAMAAIRRAMAKNAAERFGSCGEFVEALAETREMGGMREEKGGGKGTGKQTLERAKQNTSVATARGKNIFSKNGQLLSAVDVSLRQISSKTTKKRNKYRSEENRRLDAAPRRKEERKLVEMPALLEDVRKQADEKVERLWAKRNKILLGVLFGVLALFAVLAVRHMADKRTQGIFAKAKVEIAAMPDGKTAGATQLRKELVESMNKWVALKNEKTGLIRERYFSIGALCLSLAVTAVLVFFGLWMVRDEAEMIVMAVIVWLVALCVFCGGVVNFYNDIKFKEISQINHQMKALERQVVTLMATKPNNANE